MKSMAISAVGIAIIAFITLTNGNDYSSPHQSWSSNDYYQNGENDYDPHFHSQGYHHVHPCSRKCVVGQEMTCHYEFIVENYEAAGHICAKTHNDPDRGCIELDGISSSIVVANKQLPGYAIEVCENDTIVAKVTNKLNEDTTIHWHGIHQRETPHMDGAPYATQYPIHPGDDYIYKFVVSQHGTFWWHGHSFNHRAYGLAGALIARQPNELNPHAHLYDYDLIDHVVLIQDWSYNLTSTNPMNILINGKGHNAKTQFHDAGKLPHYEKFKVIKSHKYLFRMIHNGNANCPIEISIDNHELLVVGSDGSDIKPVPVKSIVSTAGERFNFVVNANEPVGNYWFRVKGLGFCASTQMHQAAILHYKGAPKYDFPKRKLTYDYIPKGVQLNPLDVGPSDDHNKITMVEVNGIDHIKWDKYQKFQTHYTSLDLFNKPPLFSFQMDGITFDMPPVSLLQARHLGIEKSFCNKTSLENEGKDCSEELCKCPNVIQVAACDYIEIVASSTTARGHPLHLHGYDFQVVGMGVLGQEAIRNIEEIDKRTPLKRRLDQYPVTKDTIQVPGYGYAIFRMYTNNKGYWMFHCHLSVHSEEGMLAILQVGKPHEMLKTPKNNCFHEDEYKYGKHDSNYQCYKEQVSYHDPHHDSHYDSHHDSHYDSHHDSHHDSHYDSNHDSHHDSPHGWYKK